MNRVEKIKLENLVKNFIKEHQDQIFKLEGNSSRVGYKTHRTPLMSSNELEFSGMKACVFEYKVEIPSCRKFNFFNKMVLRYHIYAGGGGHLRKVRFPLFINYTEAEKQLQSYLNSCLN